MRGRQASLLKESGLPLCKLVSMVVTCKWEVGLATDTLRLCDSLIRQQSLPQARRPLATGRLSAGSTGAQSLAFCVHVRSAPALVTEGVTDGREPAAPGRDLAFNS